VSTATDQPQLVPLDISPRIARLRQSLGEASCDALLVTKLENVRYLTGFSGSAGILLVTPDGALLGTDGRYRDQAAEQIHAAGVEVDLEVGRPDAQQEAMAKRVADLKRLGLEATACTWSQALRFGDLFGAELVPTRGLVERLRVVKDDGELARVERACAIADVALGQVKSRLADGISESEFAAELEFEMRRRGAQGPAFETIVASGPNSAMPHARPTDRVPEEGDLVVIDFGAIVDGYRSDMTRTICLGTPTKGLQELIDAVFAAQRAGLHAVEAGTPAGTVDEACRSLLRDAGYGEAFLHSTGHGVGLEIHEAPAVAAGVTDILPEGAIVTVEPGAYLAGRGGVRIEDTVVVTDGGSRTLTHSTKDYML
jgi:Xaa-Pro aminopeptidase